MFDNIARVDYNNIAKIIFSLDPPTSGTVNKRPANLTASFKKWEEEEKRGSMGTIPQLLFANNNQEINMLKVHCTDKKERYKMINKAFIDLPPEEKKAYINNSKKNQKIRKAVSLGVKFLAIVCFH